MLFGWRVWDWWYENKKGKGDRDKRIRVEGEAVTLDVKGGKDTFAFLQVYLLDRLQHAQQLLFSYDSCFSFQYACEFFWDGVKTRSKKAILLN